MAQNQSNVAQNINTPIQTPRKKMFIRLVKWLNSSRHANVRREAFIEVAENVSRETKLAPVAPYSRGRGRLKITSGFNRGWRACRLQYTPTYWSLREYLTQQSSFPKEEWFLVERTMTPKFVELGKKYGPTGTKWSRLCVGYRLNSEGFSIPRIGIWGETEFGPSVMLWSAAVVDKEEFLKVLCKTARVKYYEPTLQ